MCYENEDWKTGYWIDFAIGLTLGLVIGNIYGNVALGAYGIYLPAYLLIIINLLTVCTFLCIAKYDYKRKMASEDFEELESYSIDSETNEKIPNNDS